MKDNVFQFFRDFLEFKGGIDPIWKEFHEKFNDGEGQYDQENSQYIFHSYNSMGDEVIITHSFYEYIKNRVTGAVIELYKGIDDYMMSPTVSESDKHIRLNHALRRIEQLTGIYEEKRLELHDYPFIFESLIFLSEKLETMYHVHEGDNTDTMTLQEKTILFRYITDHISKQNLISGVNFSKILVKLIGKGSCQTVRQLWGDPLTNRGKGNTNLTAGRNVQNFLKSLNLNSIVDKIETDLKRK